MRKEYWKELDGKFSEDNKKFTTTELISYGSELRILLQWAEETTSIFINFVNNKLKSVLIHFVAKNMNHHFLNPESIHFNRLFYKDKLTPIGKETEFWIEQDNGDETLNTAKIIKVERLIIDI